MSLEPVSVCWAGFPGSHDYARLLQAWKSVPLSLSVQITAPVALTCRHCLGSKSVFAVISVADRFSTPNRHSSAHRTSLSCQNQVLQDVPEELKARTDTSGEASLRGHLKAQGDEQTGSQSYILPDSKDDKALHTALNLIRDIQKNSAYPPNPKTAIPN